MYRRHLPIPLRRECFCNVSHASLVSTTIADKNDVFKPVHLEAVCGVGKHRLEGLLAKTYRSRTSHVATLWLDTTLRNQLKNGCAYSVAKFSSDRVTVGAQHIVVFTRHQPRAVRLDTTRRDNCRRFACNQSVPDVHPGHFLKPYTICCWQWVGCVRAVVFVVAAISTAHRAGVSGRLLGPPSTATTTTPTTPGSPYSALRNWHRTTRSNGILDGFSCMVGTKLHDFTGKRQGFNTVSN